MDGWQRLKAPVLLISLFLQAVAAFLVIQGPSGGAALFRWELLTCLLLSIMSLILLLARREREDGVERNLKKSLDELEQHLTLMRQDPAQNLVQKVSEAIKILSEGSRSLYEGLIHSHDALQKLGHRLIRVLDQSRECSQLSQHMKGDGRKTRLADPLAQVRQNLDNLLDLSKNLSSTHASTLRLIHESLQSDGILRDKIVRAQEHLERIHYSAHHGSKIHEAIFSILGETRDNISGAHTSVSSLIQRWDQLLSLTGQIDELSRQINTQSMAVTLDLVRSPGSSTVKVLAAQFHTFAHHIKEAIHDGRQELQKTSQYLSQAGSKADHIFAPVNQCGDYLRNGVAAVKYAASELTLLQMEVNIHMNKLQETSNMGLTMAEMVNSMDRALLHHSNVGRKTLEETSQSAMHSERIASILTRQFHELNHCQKILGHNGPLMSDALRWATELRQTVATLELGFDKVPTPPETNPVPAPKPPIPSFKAR